MARAMSKNMSPGFVLLPLIAAVFFLASGVEAAETVHEEEGSTCTVCHGDIAGRLKESVHVHFGLGCVDCHGGDNTQVEWEKAMDTRKGFKGQFTAKEVLSLCNKCHGDYERMRQFGIPIDQLQQYKTSEHGKALFLTGNDRAAVCSSCHGIHRIRKVNDPESSVYPTNVPKTCGKCHSDKEQMKPFDISTTVVEDYLKGMHGRRLVEMGLAVPTCSTCHGNHGAAPPGVAEVVNICGQCHINVREKFKKSRHFRKGLECITCHNNHNNIHSTKAIFTMKREGGCLHCHPDPESKQGAYIYKLLEKIAQAEEALESAKQRIEEAGNHGFHVDDERVLLQEGHTAFLQFANEQHSLSFKKVEEVLSTTVSKAAHVDENVEIKFRTITDRRIAMSCVIAYLLIVMVLIFIKYRRLRRAYLSEQGEGA